MTKLTDPVMFSIRLGSEAVARIDELLAKMPHFGPSRNRYLLRCIDRCLPSDKAWADKNELPELPGSVPLPVAPTSTEGLSQ